MATCNIDSLPEELLLHILEYLDPPPPSQLNSRKEPSLEVTSSVQKDYKNISVVSKRWRRISLPLLFKHSRLSLEEEVSGSSSKATQPQQLLLDETPSATTSSRNGSLDNQQSDHAQSCQQDAITHSTLKFHELQTFLKFLRFNNLVDVVQTFVLLASHDSEYNTHLSDYDGGNRYPHRETYSADRYRNSATFWQLLFSSISPIRVMIVASSSNMGYLTNCAIDMRGDWAFSDMDYHILELGVDSTAATTLSQTTYEKSKNDIPYIPVCFPGIAKASIVHMKPWNGICLNEGSFLRAYATYEFFERGPPSIVASIKDCISKLSSRPRDDQPVKKNLSSLKKFVYTAILPFASHANFGELLPLLEELDVKLAPDQDSGILNDKSRVGKAQLEDCWQELFASYRAISGPFRTNSILQSRFAVGPVDRSPKIQKFICRDYQNPALVEDLDETFTWLCMPCWAEMEPGVFERQVVAEEYLRAQAGF